MSNYVANWRAADGLMAGQPLMNAYTEGGNPAYPTGLEPSATEVEGIEPYLGVGRFVYAKLLNASGCNAGDVCELKGQFVSGAFQLGAQQWAGGANSGKPLGVALVALAQNQWGWFQVDGAAIVNCSGTVAAGDGAYWNAAGVVKSAAVASKQVLNIAAVSANGATVGAGSDALALAATQAVYVVQEPQAQGAIT